MLSDKHEIFAYRSDRDTNKYQGWIPETLEDVEVFIDKVAKQINEAETWFQFVMLLKDSGKIIGDLGLHFMGEENQQVEIGCTLSKAYHGMGYATEALNCIINYLFKDLGKHRITTSIDPGNINSIKLVERIGFRKEAHFVESLFINGEWADDLVYALLKKDWNAFIK